MIRWQDQVSSQWFLLSRSEATVGLAIAPAQLLNALKAVNNYLCMLSGDDDQNPSTSIALDFDAPNLIALIG